MHIRENRIFRHGQLCGFPKTGTPSTGFCFSQFFKFDNFLLDEDIKNIIKNKKDAFSLLEFFKRALIFGALSTTLVGSFPSISSAVTSLEFPETPVKFLVSGDPNQQVDIGCLTRNCGKELFAAMMDPRGAQQIGCLSTCATDDTSCQMRCINLHEDPDVLKNFQSCILGENRCLPQRNDVGKNWVPTPSQLLQDFDKQLYSGQWYVVYGMHPQLDCFKCQRHQWKEESGGLEVTIQYKIDSPDNKRLFQRQMTEHFRPNRKYSGLLQAAGETALHQGDDWYILGGNPTEFMLIYYIGCNDSWCGFNGGSVYSRTPYLAPDTKEKVEELAQQLGFDFQGMCPIQNDPQYCSF